MKNIVAPVVLALALVFCAPASAYHRYKKPRVFLPHGSGAHGSGSPLPIPLDPKRTVLAIEELMSR